MNLFGSNTFPGLVSSYFKYNIFGYRFVFYTPESLAVSNDVISGVTRDKQRELFARITKANEGSIEKLELERQRDEINESLELIKAPIISDIDAGKSIEEIDLANKWLKSISKNGVRAQDILQLDKYRHFFDDNTVASLNKMFSYLQTSFEVSDVLGRDNAVRDQERFEAKRQLTEKERVYKLEKVRSEYLKKIENNSFELLDVKKKELKTGKISYEKFLSVRSNILSGIEEMKKSIVEDKFMTEKDFIREIESTSGMSDNEKKVFLESKLFEIRSKKSINLLADKSKRYLSGTELGKIQSALAEVRNYRGLAIHNYIQTRIADLRKIFNERKWLTQDLDLLENGLRDNSYYLQNPDSIKILLKQIKGLEQKTGLIAQKEEQLLMPELHEKLKYINQEFSHFTLNPEKAAAIISLIPTPNGKSAIYSAKIKGVNDLQNHTQFLIDLKSSINSSDEQEKLQASDTLDSIYKILRRTEAGKATRVIKGLAVSETMEEMMDCVKRNAGEHVEMVKTTKEFRAKYGNYTQGGMVFYRRGDEWKVIVDEERANNPQTDPLKFKEEMIHEMHHVEFDYDEDRMNEETGRFTSNKMWKEIKAAFVNKAKTKMPPDYKESSKSEYSVDDWKDSDVVNELYAMQDTIRNHIPIQVGTKTPFDDLVSTITTAGLLPAVKIAGFEGSDDSIVRGSEMGDEPGIEPDTEHDKSYQKINDETLSPDDITNKFHTKTITDRIEAMRKTGHVDNISDADEILKIVENKCKDNPSTEYLESADVTIKEVEGAIKQYSQKHPNSSGNPLRDVWNNTAFCSINDFVQLGKNVYEFYSRRMKRRTEDHAARLGESFFTHIPFLKELAMDASANQEKAEDEYVNEWKGRLEHKDAWMLLDMIDRMGEQVLPDKDQFKAILRILADKGRIDWRRPSLWKVLNKLQSTEKFMENDQFLMQNPDALNQKLMSAMGVMWDYDEFQQLMNKNESSYDSKKNEYISTYDKMSGQLDSRLYDMLEQFKNGNESDPTEYEAILEYAIKNGKSHLENVFFYLVSGMACGLLSADRGIHLDKHLTLFPSLDWFTSIDPPPTQQWFENIVNTYFKDEYNEGKKRKDGTSEFQTFYWTIVLNNKDVIQRTEKSAAPDAWDHDWSRGIAAIGGPDTVDRFLAGGSGRKALRPTAAANQAAGLLQWFDENSRQPGSHWDKHITEQIAGIAMFDGIMENVANSDNKTYTRKEAIIGKHAREGAIGHHGDKTAEWHWRKLQQILDIIDPVLFGMLRDKQARDEAFGETDKDGKRGIKHANTIKTYLQANYGSDSNFNEVLSDITEINDVFKNLQPIINVVVRANSDKMNMIRDLLIDKSSGKVKNAA